MSLALETTRHEWDDAYRALEAEARDPDRYRALLEQVEIVDGELRRRVGQTFTLAELAFAYEDVGRWSREALAEAGPPGWPRTLSMVEGAAFHLYARGALDYEP